MTNGKVDPRQPYVIGRLDSYFTPTIRHVDACLALLAASRNHPIPIATPERVRADIDALLDRRRTLMTASTRGQGA